MNIEQSLSAKLDEALQNEERCRELLIFWKQRRQELEALIPIPSVLVQAAEVANNAFERGDQWEL